MILSFWQAVFLFVVGLVLECRNVLSVHFLAGPCVMFLYTQGFGFCMWAALISGLFCDCVQLSPKLGFMGMSWLVSLRMLYPWRLYFFKDSLSTLAIMTYLYMLVVALVEGFISVLFDLPSLFFSLRWFVSDVFVMPVCDAGWAFVTSVSLYWMCKKLNFRFRKTC